MERSEAKREPENGSGVSDPLPLFRPEAVATPEKLYGEALRIRPFSRALLFWIIGGLVAAAIVVLCYGRFPEPLHWLRRVN
jgi:hypothetical protein